jgi:ribosomal-protein-alanine N-acetyltransferase
VLRRPRRDDAEAIFARYASDRDALKYVSWPAHDSIALTHEFLAFSDVHWAQWGAGPFLAFLREGGALVGSTGLAFDAPERASTGYVFARDAWGRGYATEALAAMVALAPTLGVRRLYAICHVDHRPSARVLEKGGFTLEGVLRRYCEFPNLDGGVRGDVRCYVRVFPSGQP